MAEDRQASLTLLTKIDDATIQRSIKRMRDLQSAEKDVAKASDWAYEGTKRATMGLPPLNAELQKKIANLRKEFWQAEQNYKANEKIIKQLKQETQARERVADAAKKQTESTKVTPTAGGGPSKSLTALAGGTSALGGLESLAGAGPSGDIMRAVSAIARLKGQIDQFAASADSSLLNSGKLTGAVTSMGGSFATVALAGGLAAAAILAISLAIKKFVEDINRYQQQLTNAIDAQVKYYELIQTGTADEIQAELERLEIRKQSVEWALRDAKAGTEAAKAMGGLEGAIASLLELLGVIGGDSKKLNEEMDKLDMEINSYRNALNSTEVQQRSQIETLQTTTSVLKAANDAEQKRNTAIDEAKRKEEERARQIQQASEDIAQARMREAQAEAEAGRKRIEKMADIARQFSQASADAFRKLQEDQAALAEKYGQERADIMLESQRDEARAAREHTRNIKAIRDRAALDEFNAARDRDFARLVEIRRGVEQEVSEETERFAAEREEANVALKERLRDAAVAYQRERAARLQDYNSQLYELRLNKRRQQEEARIAHQREMVALRQRLQDEINLKMAALQATLNATKQWAALMGKTLGVNVGLGGTVTTGTATGGTGGSGTARAFGGPLSAGQSSLVNEFGRESFISDGRSMMLPRGMGVFTPSRSGTVKPAGGIIVNQTVNASPGMSETRVAQIAADRIDMKLKELIE